MKSEQKMKFFSILLKKIVELSIGFKVAYTLLFVFLIYQFGVGLSPLRKMKEFKHLTSIDSLFIQKYNTIYNQAEFTSVVRNKSYIEALLKLSANDSIQLLVNLNDSIIGLSIKGVIIHETPITDFRIDPLLKKLQNREYLKLFTSPFMVRAQNASIEKEPIVVRHAPKDAEEASINAYHPDTLIQHPAFLELQLEYGINLLFEQDDNIGPNDKWERFQFKTNIALRNTKQHLWQFFSQGKVAYMPVISVKIPVDDLRAIYRALPSKPLVVITFGTEE